MNYTQAQIDRANAVSLEDFLRTQGETLRRVFSKSKMQHKEGRILSNASFFMPK